MIDFSDAGRLAITPPRKYSLEFWEWVTAPVKYDFSEDGREVAPGVYEFRATAHFKMPVIAYPSAGYFFPVCDL